MAIDGFEWDAPGTKENAAAFGFSGAGADDADRPAYPKVRVVTVSECASHAVVDTAMGAVAGKGAGEQSLARKLSRRLGGDAVLVRAPDLLCWGGWGTAAGAGLPSKVGARDEQAAVLSYMRLIGFLLGCFVV